jgi:L,D-peptidoglycan transpeptidase YkuD (ErfK/YbiS/YcfS/YnhG family)
MAGERRSGSAVRARFTGSHRPPRRRAPRILHRAANAAALVAALACGTAVGLAAFAVLGLGPFRGSPPHHERPASTETAGSALPGTSAGGANSALPHSATSTPPPRTLPLGARALGTIDEGTTQVIVVRGATTTSSAATIEFYERVDEDWIRVAAWQGHVGRRGWAANHVEGDLKTPVGTYTLSDAGGRQPNPGSSLPYHRSTAFEPPPEEPGFGDSMADAFDYVIAVNYNRVPGRSPLDTTRPRGARHGGGIWLHVDHGGPTHGCVSLPEAGVRYLLLHLTLKSHPVVVMGDAARLQL